MLKFKESEHENVKGWNITPGCIIDILVRGGLEDDVIEPHLDSWGGIVQLHNMVEPLPSDY